MYIHSLYFFCFRNHAWFLNSFKLSQNESLTVLILDRYIVFFKLSYKSRDDKLMLWGFDLETKRCFFKKSDLFNQQIYCSIYFNHVLHVFGTHAYQKIHVFDLRLPGFLKVDKHFYTFFKKKFFIVSFFFFFFYTA